MSKHGRKDKINNTTIRVFVWLLCFWEYRLTIQSLHFEMSFQIITKLLESIKITTVVKICVCQMLMNVIGKESAGYIYKIQVFSQDETKIILTMVKKFRLQIYLVDENVCTIKVKFGPTPLFSFQLCDITCLGRKQIFSMIFLLWWQLWHGK